MGERSLCVDRVVRTGDAAELDQQRALGIMAWIARTLVEATMRDPEPVRPGTGHQSLNLPALR